MSDIYESSSVNPPFIHPFIVHAHMHTCTHAYAHTHTHTHTTYLSLRGRLQGGGNLAGEGYFNNRIDFSKNFFGKVRE